MTDDQPTQASEPVYESNPFKLIRPSFEIFKRVFRPYLGLLALIILSVGLVALIALGLDKVAGSIPATIVVVLLVLGLMVYFAPLFNMMMLSAIKEGKVDFVNLLKTAPRYALSVVWADILGGLAFLGGLILLIVPGFVFLAWFIFGGIVVVDEGRKGRAALKLSKELVKGHVVEILALLSLATLSFVPTHPSYERLLILVSFVFNLIYFPAIFIRYFQLKALKAKNLPKPKTHWINYAVIAATILAFALSYEKTETTDLPDSTQYDLSL